jgi:RimJ/RimL family protein N-acetyltransferase
MGARWPAPAVVETARLRLEPLRAADAEEMAGVLGDPALHGFTGGRPATVDELRRAYALQAVGHSPGGEQGWLNWIVRDGTGAVGYVQATLAGDPAVADLAWVIGTAYQGRGYAREAAAGMVGWLREQGMVELAAYIHPEHRASIRVAEHLGLRPTGEIADGEMRWTSRPGSVAGA